jgi:hypothetical protein
MILFIYLLLLFYFIFQFSDVGSLASYLNKDFSITAGVFRIF